jgi:hypothetical protein
VTRAAEPSETPTTASEAAQPPGFKRTKIFSSERYGYSIRYPNRWTVEPSESDSSPDSLTSPNGPRLTIVRQAKSDDTSLARFVDAAFAKRCRRAESAPKMYRIEPGSTAFSQAIIDGHPALERGYCWRVDAVVDLGEASLVMTLQGGQVDPRGGRWTFDWLAERIHIDASPNAPAPTPSSLPPRGSTSPGQFTSTRYGFSIEAPSGWVAFSGTRAGIPDAFQATLFATAPVSSRLSIIRRPKDDRLSLGEVAKMTTVPSRRQAGRCRWGMPVADQSFLEAQIDARPALVRTECGYIDAVIDAGGDVLVVSLRSGGRIQSGDRPTFDRFMDTLDIDLSPEPKTSTDRPPGSTWSEPFTSDRYGYSIRYPPGWIPSHLKNGSSDEFYAPEPSKTRLSIVRRARSNDLALDEIALDVFSARSGPDGCHWNSAGIIYIPTAPQPFEEATIAGRPALVRSECGFVDAVIDDGDDVILVVLRSGTRKPTGDRWNFDRFMETLEIHSSAG